MNLVLDASLSLAWLFERTNQNEVEYATKVLSTLAIAQQTLVPVLWHIETNNALLVAERRKVVTEAQIIDYFSRLDALPILTDDTVITKRRELIIGLAREHNLTAYDATYLELALRTHSLLATFDTKLANAMCQAGGKLFD